MVGAKMEQDHSVVSDCILKRTSVCITFRRTMAQDCIKLDNSLVRLEVL